MKVDITYPEKATAEVTILVADEELKHAKEATLKKLQPDVSAPGFRKGKAPLNVVEKQADQDYLQSQTLDHALNDAFNQAAKDNKLRVIGQPQVNITKFVPYSELEATFTVSVVPPIDLPDYTKIKVKKDAVDVSKDDVEEVVQSLAKRSATREDVDRAAKEGDEVQMNFTGKDKDGKEVPGASGKNYDIVIGSETFIPGFEENLIGLKAGDKKEFTVRFPKDYGHAPLANADVTFSVDIQKIKEVKTPELDDAFAAKAGPFKSMKELRVDIEKQLHLQKERENQSLYRDKIIEAIADKTRVELPEMLVKDQIESQMIDFKQNLIYRGMTLEEYLGQLGVEEDEYKQSEMRPSAERRVKAGLILSEIAEQEKISVTPEELEIRMQLLKGQYQSDQQMQQELETPQAKQNIYSQLMTEKTLAKLEDYVG